MSRLLFSVLLLLAGLFGFDEAGFAQAIPLSEIQSADSGGGQSGPSSAPTQNTQTAPGNSRTKDYILSVVGPGAFIGSAVGAAIDQGRNRPSEWKQGAAGFGRRFANNFGQNAIQQTTTYGLDVAFGLDSRYRKSSKSGFFPRFGDVIVQTFTAKTRSGRRVPGVPAVAGAFASGFIPVAAWYPDRHGPRDGARIGAVALAGNLGFNFFREFIFRK
jgi:hypothetical protein